MFCIIWQKIYGLQVHFYNHLCVQHQVKSLSNWEWMKDHFHLKIFLLAYSFTHPVVAKGQPIFPRLDVEEEVAYIKLQMAGGVLPEKEWVPEEVELNLTLPQIKFDDFEKIELKVA